jgi:glycosyltransferase involved in cell wall biosynthesis
MKITIFTSCYNQDQYLEYSIKSVLSQTYTNFEYLLYDDGSTDNTWSIITKYAKKDNRIIPIKLPKQDNVGIVLNKSIDIASGNIWTWCPSDDIWHIDLLKIKLKFYYKYPNAVIYNNWNIINNNGLHISTHIIPKYTQSEFKKVVWNTSPIGFTGIFIPMKVFNIVGKFPKHLKFSEDYYWMIKATIHNIDIIGIPNILHKKRIHNNRLTYRNKDAITKNVLSIRNELSQYKNNIVIPKITKFQSNNIMDNFFKLINPINNTTYNEHFVSKQSEYILPKNVYFFWGNKTMSWMRYMSLKSFRIFNPTWKIFLYYSPGSIDKKTWNSLEKQDFFHFKGIDYFQKIKELNIDIIKWDIEDNTIISSKNIPSMGASHKSNFFKWWVLYERGGIYSDLDIIYYKPIDDFYNTLISNKIDVGICQTEYLSIGFLSGSKGNLFYKDIFKNTFNTYTPDIYQSAGVMSIYNMYNTSKRNEILDIAKNRYTNIKFYNIPFKLVYPYDSTKIEYAFNNIQVNALPNITIAYHWYAGHPIAQKYNNLLNHKNYKQYNILFTNIAKHIDKTHK